MTIKTKKKLTQKKRQPPRRSTAKRGKHIYQAPKTAAELGIVCSMCGGPAIWFDYELGEKRHMQGFVCDDHKVSTRLEKLAQPPAASVV
jgi:hypothetical protein